MSDITQFNYPTPIRFGAGVVNELPQQLETLGSKRPLLVTDKILAQLPIGLALRETLEQSAFESAVFSDIWGNPVISQVEQGLAAFREHQADAIVAMGGGASLDVAKIIALMAHHPGSVLDYEDGNPNQKPVENLIPPIIAIPTTAGTGSEVGRAAVVSDDASHRKAILFHPRLLPAMVLLDPELTLGLPAGVTAATGMDALSHLSEAFLVDGYHPMADGISLEGIRLISKSLKACVDFSTTGTGNTAEHIEARGLMLTASMMGAVAFQKGLGVTHSCAHSLSTVCDLHHGLANGIMLPFTLGFNRAACNEKFARMSVAAGADGTAQGFFDWLNDLRTAIGIPSNLREAGVEPGHFEDLVAFALKDSCHLENPVPVSEADFRSLFKDALGS